MRYGFKKFVVVVPSVAVREGVLKSIGNDRPLKALYDNVTFDYFVYSSKRLAWFGSSRSVITFRSW